MQCWSYDFTNEATCVNNSAGIDCSWDGGYCDEDGCWDKDSESECAARSECTWKQQTSSGWCEELKCWNWDSIDGGNKTLCEQNEYELECVWSGNPANDEQNGWCDINIDSLNSPFYLTF